MKRDWVLVIYGGNPDMVNCKHCGKPIRRCPLFRGFSVFPAYNHWPWVAPVTEQDWVHVLTRSHYCPGHKAEPA